MVVQSQNLFSMIKTFLEWSVADKKAQRQKLIREILSGELKFLTIKYPFQPMIMSKFYENKSI